MAKLKLTDAAIRAAKSRDKAYKLSDGRGLHLLVTPTGSRLWRMQYRFGDRQRMIAFGSYADGRGGGLSLEAARMKASEARAQLADGIDPAAAKRLDKIAKKVSTTNTFSIVADEYLAKLRAEGRAPATVDKARWLIDLARPQLGQRPIADIKPAEVLTVLQKIAARGRHETARRLRSLISRVSRYAIATARAESDPAAPLVGALTAPTVTHHAAILDAKAFGGLLRAIDGYDGQSATHAALKLMALLFPRPGELRQADWSEFDLANAVWIIPAGRTKMRREHRVPLPRQAVSILNELHKITGPEGHVFPSVRTSLRPISDGTLNAALRRLGYGKDEATPHGFRSTASTMLNELGFDPDVIEAALAHVDGNAVRRAYNRATYWDQRVELMQIWADHLDTLREGAQVIRRDFGGAR